MTGIQWFTDATSWNSVKRLSARWQTWHHWLRGVVQTLVGVTHNELWFGSCGFSTLLRYWGRSLVVIVLQNLWLSHRVFIGLTIRFLLQMQERANTAYRGTLASTGRRSLDCIHGWLCKCALDLALVRRALIRIVQVIVQSLLVDS